MIEVNKDNFDQEVLGAQGLVLVDFWGPKCDKCLALMPDIEEISMRFEGSVKFCKLDISGNRRLAIAQKVLGLPAIGFYKDGVKQADLGPDEASAASIEAKIKELL